MSGSVLRGSIRTRTASIVRSRALVAVLTLAATVGAGGGVEAASLLLTWNAPTTNADGTPLRDLASYHIYLGTSVPACPGGSFHAVSSPTSAPTTGQTFSTRITELTAGTYFARVTAVDSDGNESGCSSSTSGPAQPDVTVTPTGTTSFGSVALNSTVDRTFAVQNTSTRSISVSASVSSPFSIVSGGALSLAGGASGAVTVRFRPTTTGSFVGNVNFTAAGDTLSRAVSGSSGSATTATPTSTQSATDSGTASNTLVWSRQADRAAPAALNGAQVEGNIYPFVTPGTGVTRVRFYLDDPEMRGTPRQTENTAPHDFAGGTVTTANPFSTRGVADGPHTITAAIDRSSGGTTVIHAAFTVANNVATSGGTHAIVWSRQPDRTAPAVLHGAQVGGNIYPFVTPGTGVTRVRFYLDDPEMRGTPRQTENTAPHDFAGGTVTTANPFSTRGVADGLHTITAAIDRSSGGTTVIHAAFTVANP